MINMNSGMDYIQQLTTRYPALLPLAGQIREAAEILINSFQAGGKLLIAGNGGSASDAGHIAGELMKSFVKKRKIDAQFIEKITALNPEAGSYLAGRLQGGLPVISLTTHTSLMTACLNDIDGYSFFAQQVYAYGAGNDVFMGISTSGNSKNIYYAALCARAKGLKTIALSGGTGGELAKICDVSIIAPEKETYKIQELHLPIYHALCLLIEEHFFP
jgi:D-sedoheptulose 7-phosphate isomerase